MDILSKANSIVSEYDQIMQQMMDNEIMLNQEKMKSLSRQKSSLDESYQLCKKYIELNNQLSDLEEMKNDKEYEDLAKEESITVNDQITLIELQLKKILISDDPNDNKNAIIENSALLNSACGAFETMDTFVANNISNAIKKFISEGWWVIGLDHDANANIEDIIRKMQITDKFIIVLGSEGEGIRRLNKKNCNFLASIPNSPNTNSINVSNAAAIVFYEIFKMKKQYI